MKFKEKSSNKIIEVKDKAAIKRFQGYPDLFEEIKEQKEVKELKAKFKKNEE